MSDDDEPTGDQPPPPRPEQPDRKNAEAGESVESGLVDEHGEAAEAQSYETATWVRLSGAGMELALITIAFGAAGALADHQLNLQRPIASAVAGLIGFSLGMIRFIRLATRISDSEWAADQQASKRKKRNESEVSDRR